MASASCIDELAASLLLLADSDFHGYSPLYESLAHSLAADADTLAFVCDNVAGTSRWGRVAVLFLAAVHDAALACPDSRLAAIYRGETDDDPHQALVELVADERERVVTSLQTRSVQTNEVARSAVIMPAVVEAGLGDRPVTLIEMGPSAGLNLLMDRYRIDYLRTANPGDGNRDGDAVVATAGPPASALTIRCELRGDHVPLLDPHPVVAHRTGVDLSPLLIDDAADRRWLRACVWPGAVDRAALLDAAVAMAVDHPPELVKGDAVTDLAPMVAAAPAATVPVVVSSWALAYVSSADRTRIIGQLGAIDRGGPVALVTVEEPRFTPWLAIDPGTAPAGSDGTPTAVGLTVWDSGHMSTRHLGWCHPHGRWLQWCDAQGPN